MFNISSKNEKNNKEEYCFIYYIRVIAVLGTNSLKEKKIKSVNSYKRKVWSNKIFLKSNVLTGDTQIREYYFRDIYIILYTFIFSFNFLLPNESKKEGKLPLLLLSVSLYPFLNLLIY